jgi:hypothetical protein
VVKNEWLTATTTVVMLADDPDTSGTELEMVKVIKWAVANDGTITRPWSKQPGFRATNVAATNNVVGAFVQYFRLSL